MVAVINEQRFKDFKKNTVDRYQSGERQKQWWLYTSCASCKKRHANKLRTSQNDGMAD